MENKNTALLLESNMETVFSPCLLFVKKNTTSGLATVRSRTIKAAFGEYGDPNSELGRGVFHTQLARLDKLLAAG